MDTKKRQNHKIYIEALRRRFPDLPEEAFRRIYLERLDICHNRNY